MISVGMSRVGWSKVNDWFSSKSALSQDSSPQRVAPGVPAKSLMLEIIFEICLYPDATLHGQQVR